MCPPYRAPHRRADWRADRVCRASQGAEASRRSTPLEALTLDPESPACSSQCAELAAEHARLPPNLRAHRKKHAEVVVAHFGVDEQDLRASAVATEQVHEDVDRDGAPEDVVTVSDMRSTQRKHEVGVRSALGRLVVALTLSLPLAAQSQGDAMTPAKAWWTDVHVAAREQRVRGIPAPSFDAMWVRVSLLRRDLFRWLSTSDSSGMAHACTGLCPRSRSDRTQ